MIENAQRDINIAFVNEVTMIFGKMGISVYDVLDAARTKWNFLGFAPGLVGGHCIGVDPFYLAHAAARSEERRVGKESVRTCRSRWSPYHSKQHITLTHTHNNYIHYTH